MYAILDARKMDEQSAAHEYLQKIFRFPEYYGKNLDALYDCLSELSDLHVVLLHEAQAENYYPKVLSVLEDIPQVEIRHIN